MFDGHGTRGCVAALVALGSLAGAHPAAAQSLDLRGWIDRPGVRLVAVEFYATWCKPCMEAVPRWKALHERYRDAGLRLIVVATQDPEGQCANPGWNPDEMVCDPEGRLARAFGVGERLPAAYLWSWQGNLLVRRGHIDAVERAVQEYLQGAPRVLVEAPDHGKDRGPAVQRTEGGSASADAALVALVRTKLSETGKLQVVATQAEREALRDLARRSHDLQTAGDQACDLGQEVSANSLLRPSLSGEAGRRRLHLQLFSVESACLVAAATARWIPGKEAASVAEAVDRLLGRLKVGVQMPAGAGASRGPGGRADRSPAVLPGPIGEAPLQWGPEASPARVVASFSSTPPGAVLLLDGELLCQQTPCRREVPPGSHRVSMQMERYVPRSEWVDVARGTQVAWDLTPDFGWVSVRSDPPGLPVRIDGEAGGTTPIEVLELSPGGHEVLVTSPCHYDQGERFDLARGERKDIVLTLPPKEGAVDVSAVDAGGDAVEAEVSLDGRRLGVTPGVYRVPICGKELAVAHPAGGRWSQALQVGEQETVRVVATLSGRLGAAPLPPPRASVDVAPPGSSVVPSPEPARRSGAFWALVIPVGTAAVGSAILALSLKVEADGAYARYSSDVPGGEYRNPRYYDDEVASPARLGAVAQWTAVGLATATAAAVVWGLLGARDTTAAGVVRPPPGAPGPTARWRW